MTNKTPREIGKMQRHIFVGAGIGLYYGLFYKPSDTSPDYVIAIVLSVLAALITVIVRFWKKGLPFSVIIRGYLETLALFVIFLLGLAARKQVEQIGGRYAVTIFTTLIGIGGGIFLASRNKLGGPE